MNRRGQSEETGLSAGFIVRLVLAVAVLLAVIVVTFQLIALFTNDDVSWRARRNMHLLGDHIQALHEQGVDGSIILDVPAGFNIVAFPAEGGSIQKKPAVCKSDACLCVFRTEDEKLLSEDIVTCRRVKGVKGLTFTTPSTKDLDFVITPGVRNVHITFSEENPDDVSLRSDVLLSCMDSSPEVIRYCQGRPVLENYNGYYGRTIDGKCYVCTQKNENSCDYDAEDIFCTKAEEIKRKLNPQIAKDANLNRELAIRCDAPCAGGDCASEVAVAAKSACPQIFTAASVTIPAMTFVAYVPVEKPVYITVGDAKVCGRCFAERTGDTYGQTSCKILRSAVPGLCE